MYTLITTQTLNRATFENKLVESGKERQRVEGCFPMYGSFLGVKGEFQRSSGFHAAFIDPAFQTESKIKYLQTDRIS